MATTTWNFTLENRPHTVCLRRGTISGKREVWLDGVLIERGRQLFDAGSRHTFAIDGQPFEASVATNGLSFSYFLLQGGVPLPSERDRQKGRSSEDLLKNFYLRDMILWNELSRLLGISY